MVFNILRTPFLGLVLEFIAGEIIPGEYNLKVFEVV
jgi:hypothetical protein